MLDQIMFVKVFSLIPDLATITYCIQIDTSDPERTIFRHIGYYGNLLTYMKDRSDAFYDINKVIVKL